MAEGACDGANGLGVPFKDKFDKTLKLYSLMTTKPEWVFPEMGYTREQDKRALYEKRLPRFIPG